MPSSTTPAWSKGTPPAGFGGPLGNGGPMPPGYTGGRPLNPCNARRRWPPSDPHRTNGRAATHRRGRTLTQEPRRFLWGGRGASAHDAFSPATYVVQTPARVRARFGRRSISLPGWPSGVAHSTPEPSGDHSPESESHRREAGYLCPLADLGNDEATYLLERLAVLVRIRGFNLLVLATPRKELARVNNSETVQHFAQRPPPVPIRPGLGIEGNVAAVSSARHQ